MSGRNSAIVFSRVAEEQLGGDFCQGNIAEFIDDDELHAGPAGEHPAQAMFGCASTSWLTSAAAVVKRTLLR